MQGGSSETVFCFYIGSLRYEQLNERLITILDCEKQRRHSVIVFGVDIHALFNQPLSQFKTSFLGGKK